MSEPGAIRRLPRPGTIVPFGGDTIPSGWLLCNGAAVSRTDYARLYSAIGTAWGSGDGSTTFNLPDGRGKVLQGADETNSLGVSVKAGLPALEGSFASRKVTSSYGSFADLIGTCKGPFKWVEDGAAAVTYSVWTEVAEHERDRIDFFASNADSAYSGTTVQPPAVCANYVIRC